MATQGICELADQTFEGPQPRGMEELPVCAKFCHKLRLYDSAAACSSFDRILRVGVNCIQTLDGSVSLYVYNRSHLFFLFSGPFLVHRPDVAIAGPFS